MIELRWLEYVEFDYPSHDSLYKQYVTKQKLQYRTSDIFIVDSVIWSDWQDVPVEREV